LPKKRISPRPAARRSSPGAFTLIEILSQPLCWRTCLAELRESGTDSGPLSEAIKVLDEVSRPFVERIMNRAVGTLLEGRQVDEV